MPLIQYNQHLPVLKGLLHTKMKILSLITYPHVVPNPYKALFVFGTQFKIILDENQEACDCPLTAE